MRNAALYLVINCPDNRRTALLIFAIQFHRHILHFTQQVVILMPGNHYAAPTKSVFLFSTSSGSAPESFPASYFMCTVTNVSLWGVEHKGLEADHLLFI
jgi:hypothetical protein